MTIESANTLAPQHSQDAVSLEQQLEMLKRENARLLASEAAATLAHHEAMVAASERAMQTELFEAALRTVPIAMAVIDPELRYIRVNAACAAMTGEPVESHAGRSLRDVNPLLSPAMESVMRQVLHTGEACLNYRITRPTPHAVGGTLEVVMHITPFYDAGGEVAGICSTATDMTPWKVLQEQFFQAQKLEAVGKLAAGVAHDFNNLVTIIGSYCDLVLMDLPPTLPPREEVEEIRRAANRATSLARRMLGTAGNSALVAVPIDLPAAVREARHLLKHAAGPEVDLDVSTTDEPGVIVADATQLEQVLLNLMINAVDAMPDGGAVTIQTRNVTVARARVTRVGEILPGPYVELTVADTGTGMDDATLARIFEPFFTTKPRGKGTGLGLATVLGIVRDLGGGVDVTSAPGAGTTFTILLPRRTDDIQPRRGTPMRGTAVAAPAHETLLLVKSDDAARAGISRMLSRQGYHVLEARHGGEALRMIADDTSVAAVITDLVMPGLSGRQLADRVRAAGRPIPVLFFGETSGGVADKDRQNDRVMAGPIEADVLLDTVRHMLHG